MFLIQEVWERRLIAIPNTLPQYLHGRKKWQLRTHGERTIRDYALVYSDLRVTIVLSILFPG